MLCFKVDNMKFAIEIWEPKRRTCKAGSAMILVIAVSLISSCSSMKDAGIIVAGSTSVQPYAEILAEEYMIRHPDAMVDIQGGGSSAGIMAAQSGTCNLGMSSRVLEGDEKSLWSVEIARDGLAIIVNPANPIQNL